MPRQGRTFVDCFCYHIITRGNQKQYVFINKKDYSRYLEIIRKAKKKYKILVYSYCLMPNHVHLLVEVDSARSMSSFMHWINRGYTDYFNNTYRKVGHLWQGRFKSRPILKDEYLLNCASYIEANPVRAQLVDNIGDYKWNSYMERSGFYERYILDEIIINKGTG